MISTFYPPYVVGGAEIFVQRQAEALTKRGHHISIITISSGKPKDEILNGVMIHRVCPLNVYRTSTYQKKPNLLKPLWHTIDLWNPHAFRIIMGILKNERPDVMHVNNYKGLSLAVFDVAKRLGIPVVFTVHDYSLLCVRATLLHTSGQLCKNPKVYCQTYTRITKQILQGKVDVITAPSRFVLDRITATGFFKGALLVRLPSAIESVDNKLQPSHSILRVLYVGQVNQPKGVQVLIAAFKDLQTPNARLDIVGTGESLEEMKINASSDNRISFHGFITGEHLKSVYGESSILVVPSVWYEPFGMVIIEAFRYGIPVIGSKIGGIPEIIEDGYNGLLFEAGNVDELKNILRRLANAPDEIERLRKGALKSSREYDLAEHVRKLEDIFKTVSYTHR
jgi:glycosyltransferase involved in cell wall biosynthesis